MIPIELTQDSTGAPALDGSSGSLTAVLKFALPQLGWTLEFESADGLRAAFRNSSQTGTGYYLRVVDDPSVGAHSDARQAQVQAYSDMTDVDTGTDQHPNAGSGDNAFWGKTEDDTSGATNWRIIGTDTFFWWLPEVVQDTFSLVHFWCAGDTIPVVLVDVNNFILGAHNIPGVTSRDQIDFFQRVTPNWSATSSDMANPWARKFDGSADGGSGATVAFSVDGNFLMIGSDGSFPDAVSGSINTSRIYLSAWEGSRALRGLLPGILHPLSDLGPGSQTTHAQYSLISNISNGRNLTDVRLLQMTDEYAADFGEGAGLIDIASDWSDW